MGTVSSVLGALCIIIGFFLGAFDEEFLFPPLVWFVAAIALNTWPELTWPARRSKPE